MIDRIAELLISPHSTINEHILNINKEGELIKKGLLEKSEFPIFLIDLLITTI